MANEEKLLALLPEDVIFKICSFISVTDAAKLSLLSSEWRQIYSRSPLYLHDHLIIPSFLGFVDRTERRMQAIQRLDRILTSVQNSSRKICSFTLSRFFLPHIGNTMLMRWFDILRNGDIKCLTIINDGFPLYQIPNCFLLSSQSVVELNIGYCTLCGNLGFSQIRILTLDHVRITDECLNALLARNLNLEVLRMSHCTGVEKISICLENISVLELESSYWMLAVEEIVIENAPKLRKVVLNQHAKEFTKVSIVSAPKLNLIFEDS